MERSNLIPLETRGKTSGHDSVGRDRVISSRAASPPRLVLPSSHQAVSYPGVSDGTRAIASRRACTVCKDGAQTNHSVVNARRSLDEGMCSMRSLVVSVHRVLDTRRGLREPAPSSIDAMRRDPGRDVPRPLLHLGQGRLHRLQLLCQAPLLVIELLTHVIPRRQVQQRSPLQEYLVGPGCIQEMGFNQEGVHAVAILRGDGRGWGYAVWSDGAGFPPPRPSVIIAPTERSVRRQQSAVAPSNRPRIWFSCCSVHVEGSLARGWQQRRDYAEPVSLA